MLFGKRERRISRIMIVEDEPLVAFDNEYMLKDAGYEVVATVASLADAIVVIEAEPLDLVLTDMIMKPMDGLQFTRHVRNDESSPNPFVPIIMISGHTEKYRVEAARDAGVTEFLAKPITAQNLFARIAEIVERPRAFVRCDNYFGPDRRRHQNDDYPGPWRRKEDLEPTEAR